MATCHLARTHIKLAAGATSYKKVLQVQPIDVLKVTNLTTESERLFHLNHNSI